jgi:hypothetical protein
VGLVLVERLLAPSPEVLLAPPDGLRNPHRMSRGA